MKKIATQKIVSDNVAHNVVRNVPQDVSRMSLEEIENTIRVYGSTTKETTKEKNSIQEQIVLLMKDNPSITAEQIANEIKKISADGVRYHIRNLKAHGVIKREGSTKSGKWVVMK